MVHEDDHLIAFLDINPINDGHVLIAPKSHAPELADLSPQTLSAMAILARRIVQALRASELRCDGANLMYADGEAAGQEVMHAHLHVVPRYAGDSLRISADWGTPSRATLDSQAERLRDLLQHPA